MLKYDARVRVHAASAEVLGRVKFTDAELAKGGRTVAEIRFESSVVLGHEALLTAWPRFRGWVDDERESLIARRELQEAAGAWERSGQACLWRRHLSSLFLLAKNRSRARWLSPFAYTIFRIVGQ